MYRYAVCVNREMDVLCCLSGRDMFGLGKSIGAKCMSFIGPLQLYSFLL